MKKTPVIAALLRAMPFALVQAEAVRAGDRFVPGHVFVPDPAHLKCSEFDIDLIWEIDPETDQITLFSNLGDYDYGCGRVTGLAFSPDARRLRASASQTSEILEFDPQGNMTVVLGFEDGIYGPEGCNNIAFDHQGNFYVGNLGWPNVLRFPADGGPATILAQHDSNGLHLHWPWTLAVPTSGDVYVHGFYNLLRVTPNGDVSVFDDEFGFTSAPQSLAADDKGNIFLGIGGGGIDRYRAGDPASRVTLVERIVGLGTIYMSPDRSQVYATYASGSDPWILVAIDPVDGTATRLFGASQFGLSRCGMAVGPLHGDVNGDDQTGLEDVRAIQECMGGPGSGYADPGCKDADIDSDADVDLKDFRYVQWAFGRGTKSEPP